MTDFALTTQCHSLEFVYVEHDVEIKKHKVSVYCNGQRLVYQNELLFIFLFHFEYNLRNKHFYARVRFEVVYFCAISYRLSFLLVQEQLFTVQ